MSKNVYDHEDWLKARKKVLTATEVSAALGVNPWLTGNKVWKNKNNGTFIPNSYVIVGQILEPAVVMATNHVLGTEFRLYETDKGKPFYTMDKERIGATPDATDGTELLECKTTGPHNEVKWRFSPPPYYIIQLIVQLMCTEKETGYLAIMSTNLEQESPELRLPLSIFAVKRSAVLEKIIIDTTKIFWDTVESGKMYKCPASLATRVKLILPTLWRRV